MIINRLTLSKSLARGKNSLTPSMACISNQVIFNKLAAELLSAPCYVSFEKKGDKFYLFKDDEAGFKIDNRKNQTGTWAISSRPLRKELELIFDKEKIRFSIEKTFEKDWFILNPLL